MAEKRLLLERSDTSEAEDLEVQMTRRGGRSPCHPAPVIPGEQEVGARTAGVLRVLLFPDRKTRVGQCPRSGRPALG